MITLDDTSFTNFYFIISELRNKMNIGLLILLSSLVVVSATASNPVPLPARPHGIKYQPRRYMAYEKPLEMEVFLEVACRDAQKAFPVYLEVANHYQGLVDLVVYQFPLPYHRAAFHGSQTLRIVSEFAPGQEFCFMNTAFANQDLILDRNIVNQTETQVISIFADFAKNCGVPRHVFYTLFSDRFGNWDARTEWKYGCSRGVSGTPYVFLNGVFLTNNQDWTITDYRNVIDPLLTS